MLLAYGPTMRFLKLSYLNLCYTQSKKMVAENLKLRAR